MKWDTASMLAGTKWITAIVAAYWLAFPLAIQALVIMMGLDFATGLIKGATEKALNSDISIRGLAKKMAMLCAVLVIHLLDGYVFPLFGFTSMELGLEKIFAVYLSFNELLSVIENLVASGVEFPAVVISVLATAKKSVASTATQQQLDDLIGTKQVTTTVQTTTAATQETPKVVATITEVHTETVTPPKS